MENRTQIDRYYISVDCCFIGGADGWEEIQDFGEDHLDWLKQYGYFESGIPVHDTIVRVMGMISAKQMQKCFALWMGDCHQTTDGDVIAIDGKTLRGTYDKGRRQGAIHMVSAFSAANQLVLWQVKTAEKSNEITAIHEHLKLSIYVDALSLLMRWGVSYS